MKFLVYLLLWSSSSLFASQGLYLGGSVGGHVMEATQRQAYQGLLVADVEEYSSFSKIFDTNLTGMVFAGYGKLWDHFYLAAEGVFQFGNFRLKDSQQFNINSPPVILGGLSASISSSLNSKFSKWQFGLDLLPGFRLGPSTLLYARAGAGFAKASIELLTNIALTDNLSQESLVTSISFPQKRRKSWPHLRLGAGIEQLLSQRFALRLDYIYTDYGRGNFQPLSSSPILAFGTTSLFIASGSSHVHIYDHRALLGLSYIFSGNNTCNRECSCQPCAYQGFYIGGAAGGSLFNSTQAGSLAASTNPEFVPPTTFPFFQEIGIPSHIYRNQFCGMIWFGYGKPLKQFYLGGELFATLTSPNAIEYQETASFVAGSSPGGVVVPSELSLETSIKMDAMQYGFDLRPGIFLTRSTLLYGRVGTSIVKERAHASALTTYTLDSDAQSTPIGFLILPDKVSISKRKASLRLGLGFEQEVTRKVHLRADYIYSDYGTLSFDTNVTSFDSLASPANLTYTFHTHLRNHALVIGAVYYFRR